MYEETIARSFSGKKRLLSNERYKLKQFGFLFYISEIHQSCILSFSYPCCWLPEHASLATMECMTVATLSRETNRKSTVTCEIAVSLKL